jgi:hypothetical protein
MRRSPSIVPQGADRDIYLVLDDFRDRLGRAWRKTDEEDTDRETLISAHGRPVYPPRARCSLQPHTGMVARRDGGYRRRAAPALRRVRQGAAALGAGARGVGWPTLTGDKDGRHDDEMQFYALDMLATGGDDIGELPLQLHKNKLARRIDGIHLAPFEQGDIGPESARPADGIGGPGLETQRPALSRRPVTVLDRALR